VAVRRAAGAWWVWDRFWAGQAAAAGGPQAASNRLFHSCARCRPSGRERQLDQLVHGHAPGAPAIGQGDLRIVVPAPLEDYAARLAAVRPGAVERADPTAKLAQHAHLSSYTCSNPSMDVR